MRPKQSLGQNFLVDDNISRKIVQSLSLKADDVVLEIGPGHGALTQHLAGTVRHLIAVEIDQRVVENLRERFDSRQTTILHEDFLNIRLDEWQKKYKTPLRVVGNIPYHLTSPILFKIFEERTAVCDCTLMMQKEVARRLIQKPGTKEYGILSVFTQFYGVPKLLFTVSPNCFYPKPKVTSAIVQIRMHDKLPFRVNEKRFKEVVKTAFGKRRKTLRNSLKYLPYEQEQVEQVLKNFDFPLDKRPERLSVGQFAELTNKIEHILQ
jgi:16S rRNA (adenine1518-N6/adenine1519-N6)-dimethyltransferase